MTPDDLINAARALRGTPFRHQGRLAGIGLDCVGLLVVSAGACGRDFNHVPDYDRTSDGTELRAALEREMARVDSPEPGDVLFTTHGADAWHICIVSAVNPLRVVHVVRDYSVCEHRYDGRIAGRIVAIYRLKEFVNGG